MKICVITNLYPPFARGGAEQVVWQTARALCARGHSVFVITTSQGANTVVDDEGVRVYRLKPRNIYYYTNAKTYPWFVRLLWHVIGMFHTKVVDEVMDIIVKEHPDVVHTHNLMGLSFALPTRIRGHYPWVHTVHDVQLYEPSGIILKAKEHKFRYTGPFSFLYSRLMRSRMGSPDAVISPSQFLLDFYRSKGFFPHSELLLLRNPLTVQKEDHVRVHKDSGYHFLYVGQIEAHKGVQTVLSAFSLVVQAFPEAVLHIVGDGSLRGEVEKSAEFTPHICVHGRLNRVELADMYRIADVTVVPSLCYENSPTVIVESFAFGVPVIASNVNGITELIAEGDNGFMFEAGNSSALAAVMKRCIEEKDEVCGMGRSAFSSVPSPTAETFVDSLLSVYAKVMKK